MRKPSNFDLDFAHRAHPFPWRIGEWSGPRATIHFILDANGEPVVVGELSIQVAQLIVNSTNYAWERRTWEAFIP